MVQVAVDRHQGTEFGEAILTGLDSVGVTTEAFYSFHQIYVLLSFWIDFGLCSDL